MRVLLLLATILCTVSAALAQKKGVPKEERPAVALPVGQSIVIRSNARLEKKDYLLPPVGEDGKTGVLVVRNANGIVLDLDGARLRGAVAGRDRDSYIGFGIVLESCNDVRIQGGELGGYKACIVARDCHNLVIDGTTFSDYFAQRLHSTAAAEDPSDWLWPHENDEGQWLESYGAAISLTDCSQVTVRNCRARRGQNGLIMNRSGSCEIYDNDFSFLSGWGLGMYRSSNNVVSNNRFDYCVRGYSHGVYWRGQDSAGILMFERCSDNVVAYNRATHCGDGLFLFAGRDRVEGRSSEEAPGGSDRNLIYRNLFSYAVANGIETTFSSDNRILENVAAGCHQHGIWGGYSQRLQIVGNFVEQALEGAVSIEHGQECLIAKNVFRGNEIGVELWWDEDPEFVEGPFGARFDTDSRGHWIAGNAFAKNHRDLVIKRTQGIVFGENVFETGNENLYVHKLESAGETVGEGVDIKDWLAGLGGFMPSGHVADSTLRRAGAEQHPALDDALFLVPPPLPGSKGYDPSAAVDLRGLESIVMGKWGPWDFESGEPKPDQAPVGGLLAGVVWNAAWFSWVDGPDPRRIETLDSWRELSKSPLAQGQVRNWLTPWGSGMDLKGSIGTEKFGLIARAKHSLPAGRYRLAILSDDGVRFLIDGKVVLENWTWHAGTRDEAEFELQSGEHELTLEYFQIDGAAALTLDLDPADKN